MSCRVYAAAAAAAAAHASYRHPVNSASTTGYSDMTGTAGISGGDIRYGSFYGFPSQHHQSPFAAYGRPSCNGLDDSTVSGHVVNYYGAVDASPTNVFGHLSSPSSSALSGTPYTASGPPLGMLQPAPSFELVSAASTGEFPTPASIKDELQQQQQAQADAAVCPLSDLDAVGDRHHLDSSSSSRVAANALPPSWQQQQQHRVTSLGDCIGNEHLLMTSSLSSSRSSCFYSSTPVSRNDVMTPSAAAVVSRLQVPSSSSSSVVVSTTATSAAASVTSTTPSITKPIKTSSHQHGKYTIHDERLCFRLDM